MRAQFPLTAVALTLFACGNAKPPAAAVAPADAAETAAATDTAAAPVTLTRPILQWTGQSAEASNVKKLPSGWTEIQQTRCAKDPTRQYIGEIFKFGLNNIQVDYHWAPVVPGPNAELPTLDQPEFAFAGEIESVNDSGDDVLADHPFGLDVNAEVKLDEAFGYLANGKDAAEAGKGYLHCEAEMQLMNRKALGYHPAKGDRTIMSGAWVLDCGHPPYGSEMHPPTFLGYARKADDKTTIAASLTLPYRSSLLFHASIAVATNLSDTARFKDPATATFPHALISAVLDALNNNLDYISAHALMIANKFETLQWDVCAPLPRPAGAKLLATWRFTTRTGVTVKAQTDEEQGCVHFSASMDASYKPAPLVYADAKWSWAQLSASAGDQLGQSVDVRKEIVKIAQKLGASTTAPAIQEDHPPHIDAYALLTMRPDADQDAPTAVTANADDQAFPFYGRAKVGWQ